MGKLDFVMEIEDINRNSKRGLVVSGIVNNGSVSLGDCLEIVGNNDILRTHVAAIAKFSANSKNVNLSSTAKCGDNIEVLLTNSRNDNINIGQVLSTPKAVRPYLKFEAQFTFLNLKKDIDHIHSSFLKCSVHFRESSISKAKLYLVATKECNEKYNLFDVLINLDHTIILNSGSRFDVFYGLEKIGTGTVTKVIE